MGGYPKDRIRTFAVCSHGVGHRLVSRVAVGALQVTVSWPMHPGVHDSLLRVELPRRVSGSNIEVILLAKVRSLWPCLNTDLADVEAIDNMEYGVDVLAEEPADLL